MFYEAKQGTKTYEYIKGILDAEKRERQAYMERVKEAVGFEFDDYLCCLANDSNDRKSKYPISGCLLNNTKH